MTIQERLVETLGWKCVGAASYAFLKLLGVEFPREITRLGRVYLPHGAVGVVVHERTVMGDRVRLYQGVTIGRSDVHVTEHAATGRVELGEDVIVGANSVILFKSGELLTVGSRAVIGAGSVVTRSIPPGEVWAGNPAKFISHRPGV